MVKKSAKLRKVKPAKKKAVKKASKVSKAPKAGMPVNELRVAAKASAANRLKK